MPKRCEEPEDEVPRKRRKASLALVYDPEQPIRDLVEDFTTVRKRSTDKGRSYPAEEICPKLATVAVTLPPLWLSCGQPPKRARVVGAHDADAHNIIVCCTCDWCLKTNAAGDAGGSRGGRRLGAGAGAENLPFTGRLFNLPQWHEHATETRIFGLDADKQTGDIRHLLFNIIHVVPQPTQADGAGPSSEQQQQQHSQQQQPQQTLWEFLLRRNKAEARSVAAAAGSGGGGGGSDGGGALARAGEAGDHVGQPSRASVKRLQGLRLHVFYHEELPAGRWYTGTITKASKRCPALKVCWDAWEHEPTGTQMPATEGEVLLGVTLLHFGPQPPTPGGDGAGPAHRIRSLPSRSLPTAAVAAAPAEQGPGPRPSNAPASSLPRHGAPLTGAKQQLRGGEDAVARLVVGTEDGGDGDGVTHAPPALPRSQTAGDGHDERGATQPAPGSERDAARPSADEATAAAAAAAAGPSGSALPVREVGPPPLLAQAAANAGPAAGGPPTSSPDSRDSGKKKKKLRKQREERARPGTAPSAATALLTEQTRPQEPQGHPVQPQPQTEPSELGSVNRHPIKAPPAPSPQASQPQQTPPPHPQQKQKKQRDGTEKQAKSPKLKQEPRSPGGAPRVTGKGAPEVGRPATGEAPPQALAASGSRMEADLEVKKRQPKRRRSEPPKEALDALRMPPPPVPVAIKTHKTAQQQQDGPKGDETPQRQAPPRREEEQRPGEKHNQPQLQQQGPPKQPPQQQPQQGPLVGSEDPSMATIDLVILLAEHRGVRPSSQELETDRGKVGGCSLQREREAGAKAKGGEAERLIPAGAGQANADGTSGSAPDATDGGAAPPGDAGGAMPSLGGDEVAPGGGRGDDGHEAGRPVGKEDDGVPRAGAEHAADADTAMDAFAGDDGPPWPGPDNLPDFVLPLESEPQGRLQLPSVAAVVGPSNGAALPGAAALPNACLGAGAGAAGASGLPRPLAQSPPDGPKPSVLAGESQQLHLDLVLSQRQAAVACKADGEETTVAAGPGHARPGSGVVLRQSAAAAATAGLHADESGEALAATAEVEEGAGLVAAAEAATGVQQQARATTEQAPLVSPAPDSSGLTAGTAVAATAAAGAPDGVNLPPSPAAAASAAEPMPVSGAERASSSSQQRHGPGDTAAPDAGGDAARGGGGVPESEAGAHGPGSGPSERHSSDSAGTTSSLGAGLLGRLATQPPEAQGPHDRQCRRPSADLPARSPTAEGDEGEWQGSWQTASGREPGGTDAAAGSDGFGLGVGRVDVVGFGYYSSDGDPEEERDGDGHGGGASGSGAAAGVRRLLAAIHPGGGSGSGSSSGSATTSGCSAGERQEGVGAGGAATVSKPAARDRRGTELLLREGAPLRLSPLLRPEVAELQPQPQQPPPSALGVAAGAGASQSASLGTVAEACTGPHGGVSVSGGPAGAVEAAEGAATSMAAAATTMAPGAPLRMASPTTSPCPRGNRQRLVVLGAAAGTPGAAAAATPALDAYDLPSDGEREVEEGDGDGASSSYRTAQEAGNGEEEVNANGPGSTARCGGGGEVPGTAARSAMSGCPLAADADADAGAEQVGGSAPDGGAAAAAAQSSGRQEPMDPQRPEERAQGQQPQPRAGQALEQGQPPDDPAARSGGDGNGDASPVESPVVVALAPTHRSCTSRTPVALNLWYSFAEEDGDDGDGGGGGSGSGGDQDPAVDAAAAATPSAAGAAPSSAVDRTTEPPVPALASPHQEGQAGPSQQLQEQQQTAQEQQQQTRPLGDAGAGRGAAIGPASAVVDGARSEGPDGRRPVDECQAGPTGATPLPASPPQESPPLLQSLTLQDRQQAPDPSCGQPGPSGTAAAPVVQPAVPPHGSSPAGPMLLLPPPLQAPLASPAPAAAAAAATWLLSVQEVAARIAHSAGPLTAPAGARGGGGGDCAQGVPPIQARLNVQLCHVANPGNRIIALQQFRSIEASLQLLLAATSSSSSGGGGALAGCLYMSGPEPHPRTSGAVDRAQLVHLPHLQQLDYCLHLQASGGGGADGDQGTLGGGGRRPSLTAQGSSGGGGGGPRPGGGIFGAFGRAAARTPAGAVQMCTTYGMRCRWAAPMCSSAGSGAERPVGHDEQLQTREVELEVQFQLHSCAIQGAVGLKQVGLVVTVRDSSREHGDAEGGAGRGGGGGEWGLSWGAVVALAVWLGSGVCQVAALPPGLSQAEDGAALLRMLLDGATLRAALGLPLPPPAAAAEAERAEHAHDNGGSGADIDEDIAVTEPVAAEAVAAAAVPTQELPVVASESSDVVGADGAPLIAAEQAYRWGFDLEEPVVGTAATAGAETARAVATPVATTAEAARETATTTSVDAGEPAAEQAPLQLPGGVPDANAAAAAVAAAEAAAEEEAAAVAAALAAAPTPPVRWSPMPEEELRWLLPDSGRVTSPSSGEDVVGRAAATSTAELTPGIEGEEGPLGAVAPQPQEQAQEQEQPQGQPQVREQHSGAEAEPGGDRAAVEGTAADTVHSSAGDGSGGGTDAVDNDARAVVHSAGAANAAEDGDVKVPLASGPDAAAGPGPAPTLPEAAAVQTASALAAESVTAEARAAAAAAEELSVRERALLVDPQLLMMWEEFGLLPDLESLLMGLSAEELREAPDRLHERLQALVHSTDGDSTAGPVATANAAAADTAAAGEAFAAPQLDNPAVAREQQQPQQQPQPPLYAALRGGPAVLRLAVVRSAALLALASSFTLASTEGAEGPAANNDRASGSVATRGAAGPSSLPGATPAAAAPPVASAPAGPSGHGVGSGAAVPPGQQPPPADAAAVQHGQQQQQQQCRQKDLGGTLQWHGSRMWLCCSARPDGSTYRFSWARGPHS